MYSGRSVNFPRSRKVHEIKQKEKEKSNQQCNEVMDFKFLMSWKIYVCGNGKGKVGIM